jgi:HK97 family phage portal protein
LKNVRIFFIDEIILVINSTSVDGLMSKKKINRLATSNFERDVYAGNTPTTLSYIGNSISNDLSSLSGEQLIKYTYLANAVVYRCVNLNAQKIASLGVRVGNDPDSPNEFNSDSPFAKLLNRPNPRLSARRMWTFLIAQRQIFGSFGNELELGAGDRPIAIYPLLSHLLTPRNWVELGTEQTYEPFSRYDYQTVNGIKQFQPSQIWYDWIPNQANYFVPESPLQAAKINTDVAVWSDLYERSFLKNGGVPAHVIATRRFGDDLSRDKFRQQFQDKYSGAHNAGKIAFTEIAGGAGDAINNALQIIPVGTSQKDSQVLEILKHELEQIAIALGVPFSKLNASGRSFDNADKEDETWEEETVIPMVRDLEDSLNVYLAPRFGSEVAWFDLSKLSSRKSKSLWTNQKPTEAFHDGILTVNEYREQVGLSALQDAKGEEFYAEPVPVAPAIPEPAPVDTKPVAKSTSPVSDSTRSVLVGVDRVALWERYDRRFQSMESIFEKQFKYLFRKQRDTTLNRLNGKRGKSMTKSALPPDAGNIFDKVFWIAETTALADPLFSIVFANANSDIEARFSISFDIKNPIAEKMVLESSNRLAGNVTDTTYRAITSELAQGASLGETIGELSKRVEKVFDQADSYRATMIARTEVVGAYNRATDYIGGSLGTDVVAGKEWLSTQDSRTRDTHIASPPDRQRVAIDGFFSVGGRKASSPHDPNLPAKEVVHCRCTQLLLTPEEMKEGL